MPDFQKLVGEVEANFKPQYDHAKLEDHILLGLYCIYAIQGCQCVIRILNTNNKAPFTRATAQKASQISRYPSPENLGCLYEITSDERPLKFLIRLRLEHRHILDELDRRHRFFEVGRAFILMDAGKWQPEDAKDLDKLLKVEKITSYRPGKEDAEDLKSEAITAAVGFFRRRHELLEVKQRPGMAMPSLPQDLGLPLRDPEPWGLWHRYNLDRHIEEVIADYHSLFFGQVDRVKEASRQHLRNHFEKWEAKKRIGEDVSLEEADKTALTRSRSRVWRKKAERLEEEARSDISQRMFEVLKMAKKRWGAKAVKALRYLFEGKPEEEAARLAGITARTVRNYKLKLTKEFSQKK